jgi:hypothetical protein
MWQVILLPEQRGRGGYKWLYILFNGPSHNFSHFYAIAKLKRAKKFPRVFFQLTLKNTPNPLTALPKNFLVNFQGIIPARSLPLI